MSVELFLENSSSSIDVTCGMSDAEGVLRERFGRWWKRDAEILDGDEFWAGDAGEEAEGEAGERGVTKPEAEVVTGRPSGPVLTSPRPPALCPRRSNMDPSELWRRARANGNEPPSESGPPREGVAGTECGV